MPPLYHNLEYINSSNAFESHSWVGSVSGYTGRLLTPGMRLPFGSGVRIPFLPIFFEWARVPLFLDWSALLKICFPPARMSLLSELVGSNPTRACFFFPTPADLNSRLTARAKYHACASALFALVRIRSPLRPFRYRHGIGPCDTMPVTAR